MLVHFSSTPFSKPILQEFKQGVSLQDIADDLGLDCDYSQVFVNGVKVFQKQWPNTYPYEDAVINAIKVPQGLEVGTWLAITLVSLAAGAAIGYYMYEEPPEGPGERERLNRLQGSRNESKRYEPVPLILGRTKITPPYATRAYTERSGDDEYLNMLLCLGYGPLKVYDDTFKIGDTDLSQYEDVTYELLDHFERVDDEAIKNFWPNNIIQDDINTQLESDTMRIVRSILIREAQTGTGRGGNQPAIRFDLYAPVPGTAIVRTSPSSATKVKMEFSWPQGTANVGSSRGNWSSAVNVNFTHQGETYTVVSYSTGGGYYITRGVSKRPDGQFLLANNARLRSNRLFMDMGSGTRINRGRDITQFLEFDYPELGVAIFNFGEDEFFFTHPSVRDKSQLFTEELTRDAVASRSLWGNSLNERRLSLSFPNPFGESIQVSAKQLYGNENPLGSRTNQFADINLDLIQFVQELDGSGFDALIGGNKQQLGLGNGQFQKVFRPVIMALRIKATNQLSGTLDNLSVEVQSAVPTDWNADWRDWPNLNLAITENPADAYRWLLQGPANNSPVRNDKIRLDDLLDWRDRCVDEGWRISSLLNDEGTLQKELNNVAYTGRAEFSDRGGKYGIVEKVAKTIPVQVFTPRNSWDFSSEREFPEVVDGLKFEFENEDEGYDKDEGTFFDPTIDPADRLGKFDSIDLWGVPSGELATKHARFAIFEKKLRREVYSLSTDFEGLVAGRGDLVRINHDVIDVGLGRGRITSLDGANFTLDEEIGVTEGSTYFFQVRTNSGSFEEFSAEYQGDQSWLAESVQDIAVGDLAVYGEQGLESLDCIVREVDYSGNYEVKLILVNAANELFDIDDGAIPEFETGLTPRASEKTPQPPSITISGVEVNIAEREISVRVTPVDESGIEPRLYSLQYKIRTETLEYENPPTEEELEELEDEDDLAGVPFPVDAGNEEYFNAGQQTSNRFTIPIDQLLGEVYTFRARVAADNGLYSGWSEEREIILSSNNASPVENLSVKELTNTPRTPDAAFSTMEISVVEPDDKLYGFSLIEYRVQGQENFQTVGRVGSNFEETQRQQVIANGITYEFRSRSVSIFGVESTVGPIVVIKSSNVTQPEVDDPDPADFIRVPNVTGLEIYDQGNDNVFTGRDVQFEWRKSTIEDWIEIGQEGKLGASSAKLDQYFRDYQVEVWANNKRVHKDWVEDALYTYTYEQNAEDFEREEGVTGAYRDFQVRVLERGRNNQISKKAAKLSVTNPPIQALGGLQVEAGFNVIDIEYDLPIERDFAGVDVWVSDEAGIVESDPVRKTVSDNTIVLSGLEQGTDYFVRLRPFDVFGRIGSPLTAEFAVTTKTGIDVTGLSGWAYQIEPVNREFIEANIEGGSIDLSGNLITGQLQGVNLADAAVDAGKLADLSVSAGKLADSSVEPEKIANLAVGTAAIANGAITNAKIENLAVDNAKIEDAAITNAKIGDAEITDAKIIDLTATKLTAGVINATETITSEGLIRAVDDLADIQTQVGIGPAQFGADTYLFWADRNGELKFGVDEFGNVISTGVFSFGDVEAGQSITFDGEVLQLGNAVNIGRNEDFTVTVGSGGDFATINEALEALSRTVPAYKKGGFTATVTLLSGFVMQEQVEIRGIDLSWILMESQDSEVIVDETQLSTNFPSAIISCFDGGRSPFIDLTFSYDPQIDNTQFNGFHCNGSGSLISVLSSGVLHANIGVQCVNDGVLSCTSGVLQFKNCATGVYCSSGGQVLSSSDILVNDCLGHAIHLELSSCLSTSGSIQSQRAGAVSIIVDKNSRLSANSVDSSDSQGYGVLAQSASTVSTSLDMINVGCGVKSDKNSHISCGGDMNNSNNQNNNSLSCSDSSTITCSGDVITSNNQSQTSAIDIRKGSKITISGSLFNVASRIFCTEGSSLLVGGSLDNDGAQFSAISLRESSSLLCSGSLSAQNAGGSGLSLTDSSEVRSSSVINVSGAGSTGISITRGCSVIAADGISATDCDGFGVSADASSEVFCGGTTNTTGSTQSPTVRVSRASIIKSNNYTGATFSQAVNTITGNGIIFDGSA